MVRRSATGLELVLHKGWTQTLHRPIHTDTRMIAASARSSAGSCWAIAVRKGTMPLVVVAGRAALALAVAAVWAGMAEARGAVAVEMKTVMGLARKLVAVAMAAELRGTGSYTGRSSFLGCFLHNTLGTNLAPVAEKTVSPSVAAVVMAEKLAHLEMATVGAIRYRVAIGVAMAMAMAAAPTAWIQCCTSS